METVDIVVVGAGVIGLTTAVVLAERGARVRIVSADAPRATASVVAGAMVGGPVISEPRQDAVRWSDIALRTFGELAQSHGNGVHLEQGRLVSSMGTDEPSWAVGLPGYRPCTPDQHAGFPIAFWISTPLIDMRQYLDFLRNRFESAGGRLDIGRVSCLDDLDAPFIVNCAGLGARELADDQKLQPVRGQHVIVENPGLKDFFLEGGPVTTFTSFMPHSDRVVLGGVADSGDDRTEPDPEQTEQILERCAAVEPRLAQARVLGVEVGLRPGRSRIRVEGDPVGNRYIVHNYGHGGVGVGLSWGCAADVVDLIQGVT
ncbi:FAD-dependent oxidoreductase [Nocardia brasiliensis]